MNSIAVGGIIKALGVAIREASAVNRVWYRQKTPSLLADDAFGGLDRNVWGTVVWG